ncbi:Hypothetical protein CINCED_3A010703 [Cinara cedri]|uniref:Uncharacterized protein n=1 Tax=Cinara cedri TaxID=506608 RepID=A0A5E4NRF8_9HEMI|nr:Hypothetical protein CINCED_3A010703 [Cinara cedri]
MAIHIRKLMEISGLDYQRSFKILEIELSDYEERVIQNTTIANDDKLIALYQKCFVKLYEISINYMNMEAYIPIQGISVSETTLPEIWIRIESLKQIAKNYISNFHKFFQDIIDNRHIHNVMVNSIYLLWINIIKVESSSFHLILSREILNNMITSRPKNVPKYQPVPNLEISPDLETMDIENTMV